MSFTKFSIIILILSFSLFCKGQNNNYVKVKNHHFYRNGQRVRLWGVDTKYSGAYNYKGAEVMAKRLKQLGFNCVHLFHPYGTFHSANSTKFTAFKKFKKGSQKGLDLLDYLVFRCKQEGVLVSLHGLNVNPRELTPAMHDSIYHLAERKDIGLNEWKKLFAKAKGEEKILLRYVDPSIKQAHIEHMKFYLNRLNPYTGKRYAEEDNIAFYELNDELSFVSNPPRNTLRKKENLYMLLMKQHWQAYLKEKYQTTENLQKAWGVLLPGESIEDMEAVFYRGGSHTPAKRAKDAWIFLYGLSEKYFNDYMKVFRAQAPGGVGCNVAPVAINSVIFNKPGHLYDSATRGTFVCGASFHHGGGIIKNKEGKAYWTPLGKPPHDTPGCSGSILKIKNMPHCPVAGQNSIQFPYRAMTPFFRCLWASFQDWDGAFMYQWGYLDKPLRPDKMENFAKQKLQYDLTGRRGGLSFLLNDETALAVYKIASGIFRNFQVKPAANPTIFTFGKKALFGEMGLSYYHRNYPYMAKTAVTYGAEIAFDPTGDFIIKSDGKVAKDVKCPIVWGNGVTWNWEKGFIKLDNEYAKGYVGLNDGSISFKDGISLKNIKRKFVAFLISSQDNKPLNASKKLEFCAVSKSYNKGYRESMDKIKFKTFKKRQFPQYYSIIEDPGNFPVVFERVDADLILQGYSGTCKKYDFMFNEIALEPFTNIIKLKSSQPLFTAVVTMEK